jgi:co-chaperonin GroES (HSP10)
MIHFDRDCEPASDIVVLRIIDNDTLSSKSGGFVIGDDSLRNLRVGFAKIEKIGKEAKENTGLDVGAYVFYDKLATFYHTEPVAMLRWNALIMESNPEKTKYRAMAGRCIVQEVNLGNEEAGGFVIPGSDEMHIGVIKSITPPYTVNPEAYPFKVGDKILLTKEERDTLHGFKGDSELDPTKPILIYKTDAIICKLND